MHNKPKNVILTLHYNQPEITLICIESILNLTEENFVLYIVDNFSIEEKYQLLKNRLPEDERVKIIRTPRNLGYGKGINFGLEKTKHLEADYWLIMNNDTIIDSYALTELMHTAEKYDRNAIVSGKIYNLDDPTRIQYIGGIYSEEKIFYNPYQHEIDIGQADHEMEMEMIDDIFWLLPNKIFQKLGGYCPYYFMYGEQSDYAEQAKKNGFKLIYNPKAKLWHKGQVSSGEYNNNSIAHYWRSKSGMIFYFRNRSKKYFIQYFLKTFSRSMVKLILFFFTKDSFMNHLARFLGIISFIKWVFIREVDYGYNPFIKREK